MKRITLMLIILASANAHAVRRQDTISAGAELAIKREAKTTPNIIEPKQVVPGESQDNNPSNLPAPFVPKDGGPVIINPAQLPPAPNLPAPFVPKNGGPVTIDPSQLPPAPNLPAPFAPKDGSPVTIDPSQLPPAPNLPAPFVPKNGSPVVINPEQLPPAPSTSKPKRPLPATPQNQPATPSAEDIEKQSKSLTDAQKRKLNDPEEVCVKYLNPEQEEQAKRNIKRKNFLEDIKKGKGKEELKATEQQKYEPSISPMEQQLRDKIKNIRRATAGDSTDDNADDNSDSDWED